MVYSTEKITDNSPISPNQHVTVKKNSPRKPLHQFPEALDVKPKTSV